MLSEYKNKLVISIITVVKNNKKTIESTIKSVLNQTYSNIEYIIIDGASTDGTVDILNKYNEKITYWCSESDKGIYDAMNKALSISTGNYIYFLGSDDILSDTNTISSVANFIAQNRSEQQRAMFYGDIFNRSSNILKRQPRSIFSFAYLNICHQAIFYNREMLLNMGGFDIRYKISADHVVNLKLWNSGSFYMPIEICKYAGDGASSLNRDQLFAQERNSLILSNLGIFPLFFQLLIKPLHWIFKLIFPKHLYQLLLKTSFSR
jgi:glycosyltransferase involved in cell wall biosynthesis